MLQLTVSVSRRLWPRIVLAFQPILLLVLTVAPSRAEPLTNVGVTVSLSAEDQRQFMKEATGGESGGFPMINYVETTERGKLQIVPQFLISSGFGDTQRWFDYLALFKKGGPIEALGEIGPPRISFNFPSLDVRVVNNSQRRLLLSEAVIKVSSSESDLTPLVFIAASEGESDTAANYFAFFVLNEGWAPMESCSVKFSISTQPWKREPVAQFERTIGQVTRQTPVDISRELIQSGLPSRWIEEVKSQHRPDENLMKPFSGLAYVAGSLSYSWHGQNGSTESNTVRFRVNVPLSYGPLGGPEPVAGRYEAMLRSDARDYSISVPVSHQIDPATSKRFLVRLGAPRTSRHPFLSSIQMD